MRIISIEWAAWSLLFIPLCGCTTIASRVAVVPPGTNKYSFRECLLDRGFYSYDALTGIAFRDWGYRHEHPRFKKDKTALKDRFDWLEQSDGAFVANSAKIISEGLMPSQQFWDPALTDAEPHPQTEDRTASGAELHFDDRRLGRPYVSQAAPQRYPIPSAAGDKKAGLVAGANKPSIAYAEGMNWRLNRFLDCYIAPVGILPSDAVKFDPMAPAGLGEYGDDDIEGRLLRGHILLALLTRYGTEIVVSHASKKQVAQAEMLLGHVKDAEISLRRASLVMDEKTRAKAAAVDGLLIASAKGGAALDLNPGRAASKADDQEKGTSVKIEDIEILTINDQRGTTQLKLEWSEYTTRLLRVFQVGVDIQRIDAQQTLDRITNLVAAFSGPVAGFEEVLRDGIAGVVTVQKIKLYGGAYIRDARASLAVARNGTSLSGRTWSYHVPTLRQGWALWDEELNEACRVLATVAKRDTANAACVPSLSASGAGA